MHKVEFTEKELKHDTSYGILSIQSDLNYELETEYINNLCTQYLVKDLRKKAFLITDNQNINIERDIFKPFSPKGVKICGLGQYKMLNFDIETITEPMQRCLDLVINSLIVFNKFLPVESFKKFLFSQTSNDIIFVRNSIALMDYELELIKKRPENYYYMQIFENTQIDYRNSANIEPLHKSYGDIFIYVLFAQYFANEYKRIFATNKVMPVRIDLKNNKIIGLNNELIKKVFPEFCSYYEILETDLPVNSFMETFIWNLNK